MPTHPRWFDPTDPRAPIPVLLRRFPAQAGGGVFALLPTLPGTTEAGTCLGYAHVGQHSPADIAECMKASHPADWNDPDAQALLTELRRPPFRYVLRPVARCAEWMHAHRRAAR